jgi:hypothetical protein
LYLEFYRQDISIKINKHCSVENAGSKDITVDVAESASPSIMTDSAAAAASDTSVAASTVNTAESTVMGANNATGGTGAAATATTASRTADSVDDSNTSSDSASAGDSDGGATCWRCGETATMIEFTEDVLDDTEGADDARYSPEGYRYHDACARCLFTHQLDEARRVLVAMHSEGPYPDSPLRRGDRWSVSRAVDAVAALERSLQLLDEGWEPE